MLLRFIQVSHEDQNEVRACDFAIFGNPTEVNLPVSQVYPVHKKACDSNLDFF